MAFQLTSTAFADGGRIPAVHTCDGENLSPDLEWSGAPEATRSFMLLVHDPDAPGGDFTHWVLYDIPEGALSLPAGPGADAVGVPGHNGYGRPGYNGPCPPPGSGAHRYVFTLCALDLETLDLPMGTERAKVERAVHGHVLGTARITGLYERRR